MEQTVNQFSKGLQMDTHPMVQGNDSLSDALNATFVTMNGNEVILQNDMGNRRVDNAFLPPGYQPVGMKEYGGIIYVAAYNPITNKSQIGSFPSPERKIDENDDEDLGGTFDFDIFLDSNKGNVVPDAYLGINVLNTDSFLIPLSGDKSLRAGDKFAVFSQNLSSIQYLLTNYNNTKGNKAESPKNRKYTLQLGVLNSQNEFVDITKTLCRWEEKPGGKWQPKKYDYSYSDVYKFNDGYFISDDFSNLDLSETIKDSNLIKSRQRIATNTYAYKLIGPLYLKASLNHPYNFNYTIYGTYDGGEANLKIVGYLTYNCPDNPEPGSIVDNSNQDYSTFDEGRPRFTGFELIGQTALTDKKSVSTYNPNNNLYSVKITKEYSGIQANPIYDNGKLGFGQTETTYNYTIGVLADIDTPDVYLRGLSVRGSIDLALLGSGKVFLTGWRFYNDVEAKRTYLFYSFNSYPKEGKHFDNLVFKFVDVLDNTNQFTYPREGGVELTNGAVVLDWDEYNIQPRTLYSVTATYDYADDDSNNGTENRTLEDVKRWFLSTPLFNDFYQASEKVPDFCDFNKADLSKPEFLLAKEKFQDLMKINFKGSADYNSDFFNNETEEFEGGLIQKDDPNMSYVCTHKIKIDLQNRSTITINNEDYYPKGITINPSAANNLIMTDIESVQLGETKINNSDNLSEVFKSELRKISGNEYFKQGKSNGNVDNIFNNKCQNLLSKNLIINGNEINGEIIYKDVYVAYSDKLCTSITNAFDDFDKLLDDQNICEHFGIIIDWSGSKTRIIALGRHRNDDGSTNNYECGIGGEERFYGEDSNNKRWKKIIDDNKGGSKSFKLSAEDYYDRICKSFFDTIENNSSMFYYIFLKTNSTSIEDFNHWNNIYHSVYPLAPEEFIDNNGNYESYSLKYKTRVWWRGTDNKLALFQDFIKKDENNIKNFVKSHIKRNYIYCMYDEYIIDTNTTRIYIAPSVSEVNQYFKYTIPYEKNIPYILKIKYQLTGNENEIINIESGLNITGSNLNFTVGDFTENSSNIISLPLSSSTNFHDNINKQLSTVLNNVYLQTLEFLPENDVNRSSILYKDSNGHLYKDSKPKFKVSNNGGIKNILLYDCENIMKTQLVGTGANRVEEPIFSGDLKYVFQSNTGDDDEYAKTTLIYDQVYLVEKEGEQLIANQNEEDRIHAEDKIHSVGQR